MGQLNEAIQTENVLDFYEIKNFVETGTGIAEVVRSVHDINSDLNIHTIEVMEQTYQKNKIQYSYLDDINWHLGTSFEILPKILPDLKGNTLFWMDDEFPGAEFGVDSYGKLTINTGGGAADIVLKIQCSIYSYESGHTKQEHGAHCTGNVAGNTQGWARDANIYNLTYNNDAQYVLKFHKEKPVNFYTCRPPRSKDGVQPRCIPCCKEYERAKRKINPAQLKLDIPLTDKP